LKSFYTILLALFTIFNSLSSQDGNTPTNLQVDAASIGGVQLSWETPENFRRNWVTHSNSMFAYGIGQVGGGAVFYGQKYPDSLLSDFHGMLVKEIAFVPADTCSFQPLIFETNPADTNDIPNWTTYSNLVLSAPLVRYEDGFASWKTVELKNHVPGSSLADDLLPSSYTIDSTKNLYFGYVIYNYPLYPAGSDVGPAVEGLGNVVVYCNELTNECGETTTTLLAAEGSTLNNNWMTAISLMWAFDSSRMAVSANQNYLIEPTSKAHPIRSNISLNQISAMHGPRDQIFLDIYDLENLRNRDVSNYFVFENGVVADVVQPDYVNFNTTIRERSLLGPRSPGVYTYYVRAQTADGLSDSSNVISLELVNNSPGNFNLIAPENNVSLSITSSNLNNPIMFIWTNSVDTDGQDLTYSFEMCTVAENAVCFDTSMTERILQLTNQSIIDSLNLNSGNNVISWRLEVSDGIDTTQVGGNGADSIRYLTFAVDQLELDIIEIPNRYSLNQNYPNPFNPFTTISYQMGKSEFVNLSIFDLNGNLIKNILSQHVKAGPGIVQWDGKNYSGQNVSGGIYFYTIETPSFLKSQKMILLK